MIEHKHLIVKAKIENPPKKSEMKMMEEWFRNLVEEIDMKILAGPFVRYVDVPGNAGFTGVCIIETSHIAMHVWDEQSPGTMQLDVYTCGSLDINTVFENLHIFSPVKIEYKFLDREHNLKTVIDEGEL